MTPLEEFIEVFGVWKEAAPYLQWLVDESDVRLVLALGKRSVAVESAATAMRVPVKEAESRLQRAYSRYIVDKVDKCPETGNICYRVASFEARLTRVAISDEWDEIPEKVRRDLDRFFLDKFTAQHQADVERKIQGLAAENAQLNDTILLLDEVDRMIDNASTIVVLPCDCRRLGQNCERPVEICFWFDDSAREILDRGHGRRITPLEAKALVRHADKAGLMHTGDSEWRSQGLRGLCNCCACDCYPFRAAVKLDSKGIWPRSRYVAVYDQQYCTLCGICVERCHFGAFSYDGTQVEIDDKTYKNIMYDPDLCWGCGLCANSCPSGAIVMEPLP